MTEDEAKTKWCPHAVASHTDPRGRVGFSRDEVGLPADTWTHACIGSACMAWRWAHKVTDPHSDAPYPSSTGYCGLAGAPQ